jgi:hypothetical protein
MHWREIELRKYKLYILAKICGRIGDAVKIFVEQTLLLKCE